ncbi:Endoribonuclease L-PSP/chorismate mutase-like protein [Trichoderma chlorosporum]
MPLLPLIISSLATSVLASSMSSSDNVAAGPVFIGTPGFGQNLSSKFHYSQAVRIGNYVRISGQGGWNPQTGELTPDIATQVNNAFDSLSLALTAAGSTNGLCDLIAINSYHVGDLASGLGNVTAVMEKRIPTVLPAWTAVGVTGLAFAEQLVEIQAEAWIK